MRGWNVFRWLDSRSERLLVSNYYDPAPPRSSNTATVVLIVVLVMLVLVVLACGGIAAVGFFAVRNVQQQMDDMVAMDSPYSDGSGDRLSESSQMIQQEAYAEASELLDEALLEYPDDPMLLNQKAWLLATCPDATVRDGQQAVELATRACEFTAYENVALIDTLAAAYAEAGDFESAVEWQRKALDMNTDPTFTEGLNQRLLVYRAESPYREGRDQQPAFSPEDMYGEQPTAPANTADEDASSTGPSTDSTTNEPDEETIEDGSET